MAQKITFSTQPRTIVGKQVGQLRRQGLLPGNISGSLEKTIPVVMDLKKFNSFYTTVGDTGLFYLTVEGETKDRPVMVTEVQRDPVSAVPLHVMFRQVNLSEKITTEVPIEVTGVVEVKGAILVTLRDVVEVEALPQDFPEKFEIDASVFTEIGQMITYRDLQLDPSKVKLMIDESQMGDPVIMLQELKEETEAESSETPAADAAATSSAPAAEPKKS